MTGASKIPIDAQLAAVAFSAAAANAAAEYHAKGPLKDGVTERAAALDAAVRTLAWVRDNAAALRRAVRGGPGDERRRFADLPLGQQAALRCSDPRFQKFVHAADVNGAAEAVRRTCGVESRAEFDKDAGAAALWRRMDAGFEAWLRGMDSGETP